jgi:4-diphosphocytidyl-2-C-methyl-D-erythritol kinase
MHEVQTVFHTVNIFDRIRVARAEGLSLTVSPPVIAGHPVPADESNLCLRAARALLAESGSDDGATIELEKTIPSGAGLGGGSSDAAATLILLNELWDLRLTAERLAGVAGRLGADVRYFLGTGSALGKGTGGDLRYFSLHLPYSILIVYPRIAVSTVEAYGMIRPHPRPDSQDLDAILLANLGDPERLRALVTNDFEESVFTRHPRLAEVKERLLKSGALLALMTGSGSALFGFFADERSARDAGSRFAADCAVFVTPRGFSPAAAL